MIRPVILCLAITALSGCAATADSPDALERARAAYRAAETNPHVSRFAPVQLNQAGLELAEAERLVRERGPGEAALHRAYIAEQRARIALEVAEARTARAEMEQAGAQRRAIVAESGQRRAQAEYQRAEAERARAEAARSQAEAQQQRAAEQLAALEAARKQERLRAEWKILQLEAEMKNLKARRTARGWEMRFGSDVLFEVGDATLKPGARRSIENLARFLRSHPERQLIIEGYTDSTGPDEANLDLARQRANAVARAVVNAGVDPGRVETRAFGEALPIASNDTAAGRQLNRRVEIVIPDSESASVGTGRR